MHDPEIEEALRKFRAVGPPGDLRGRIIAAPPAQRFWLWIAAAAALLAVLVTSDRAARHEAAQLGQAIGADTMTRLTEDLDGRFGSDGRAHVLAELAVLEHQLRAEKAINRSPQPDPMGGIAR